MEEVGVLVRELSVKGTLPDPAAAAAAAAAATSAAAAEATRAASPSSDDADVDPSLRRLYRKQSTRTRTIGGLDEEGVSAC